MSGLPILALDFDGVIHRYSKGWQNGEIYDPPTPGFKEWAGEAAQHFRLVIVSSRLTPEHDQTIEIRNWMESHGIDPRIFELSLSRPPALITIDDRALTFTGDWGDFPMKWLKGFKPWHQK